MKPIPDDNGGSPAVAGTGVRVCEDPAAYVAAADRWRSPEAFPVLDGPALRRYREVLGGRLPAPDAVTRDGVVLSTGGEVSRAAALLLARATGRDHHHLAPERVWDALRRHADALVCLVGLVDDLDALGDWPGTAHPRVGVVTARSAEALSALVYRSLTVETTCEERVYRVAHPRFRSAAEADAVELSELRRRGDRRPRVLVLLGQGRECTFGLLDGMICGRNGPHRGERVPLSPGQRAMPCMHGEGCFRTDLSDEDLMPAAEVNAGLVFTHSCSSIAIGTNAYPHLLSLALGLLEGTAVAVIGSLGVHVAQRSAQGDLEDALVAQAPLGEVVRRLNDGGGPLTGELVRFGLLGDPGLVLTWQDPQRVRRRPTGTPAPREAVDPRAWDRLAYLNGVVLPRLERLRWLELKLPEQALLDLRGEIRKVAATLHEPGAEAAVAKVDDTLAELQFQAVQELVSDIYERGWQFGDVGIIGFEQVAKQPARCKNCGGGTASHLRLRHRLEPELEVQTLQCRRCGDVWWSTEPGERTMLFEGPVDLYARRGEAAPISRRLTNAGSRELRGAAGYAFRSRRYLGLPPGTSERCRVAPGETWELRHQVDLVTYQPQPDTHTTPFVALVNGVYLASMVMLNLS